MTEPADQSVRDRVVMELDESFLVRAPAGSGKTGLLTQRFLGLLSKVENPEEIVAVTFTRKAAAEMRSRILNALDDAATNASLPENPHDRRYFELARAALEQDQAQGWNLIQSPARLRVTTIDSLCASLARQMPLLSRFGAQPALTENASDLYRLAAQRTIEALDHGLAWSGAVERLLQHLDNKASQLADLLANMLQRRDQWLRHVAGEPRDRAELEQAFAHLLQAEMRRTEKLIPAPLAREWVELAGAAAQRSQSEALAACAGVGELPGCESSELPLWHALIELLLTSGGEWRKSLTAKQGFPAPSEKGITSEEKAERKADKERVTILLKEMSAVEGLLEQLRLMRMLPDPEFEASHLEILEALFQLLWIASGELHVLFREHGCVDFVQMVHAAARALGEPEQPTDLALALDYRIRHLMVDEFQDTSQTQFDLLQRLTAGWTPGDGHSLLLVGDPMQSIYRFREADVGLFQKAGTSGLGDLRPVPVELSVNFRSDAGIVDWVNREFPQIMPRVDDPALGAVRYVAAEAAHAPDPDQTDPVRMHPFLNRQDASEAERVVEIVREAKRNHPDGSIGVLARGRNHLKLILPALRAAEIRYRAIDIEPLNERPIVQDLLALTAALLHPADRIAWIAVLRAPWCGLSLADLLLVSGTDRRSTLLEQLRSDAVLADVSDAGRRRLERVMPVLFAATDMRLRSSLREWVEGTWMALGGPACVAGDADIEDACVYLQMLEEFEPGVMPDIDELVQKAEGLYALPDPHGDPDVQIMTLHKSKGLEFDTVIIPRLGQSTGKTDRPAMRWKELPGEGQSGDLLVAPIPGADGSEDPRFRFLGELERISSRLEDGRLLYVGATRARKCLHLLGHVGVQAKEGKDPVLKQPIKGSLLEKLWSAVEADFESALVDWQPDETLQKSGSPVDPDHPQKRLTVDWEPPAPPAAVAVGSEQVTTDVSEILEFSWVGVDARHVGTIAHRLLQHLAESPALDAEYAEWVSGALRARGLSGEPLSAAADRVLRVASAASDDERGRWILDPAHLEARNEMALTVCESGRAVRRVIDRTFVDAEGTRWIIDYKTGSHQGSDPEAFLDQEQLRYQSQLDGYAAALSRLDHKPIRLGLWFPLMGGWREWAWVPEG